MKVISLEEYCGRYDDDSDKTYSYYAMRIPIKNPYERIDKDIGNPKYVIEEKYRGVYESELDFKIELTERFIKMPGDERRAWTEGNIIYARIYGEAVPRFTFEDDNTFIKMNGSIKWYKQKIE
jgi:hypothetical protein